VQQLVPDANGGAVGRNLDALQVSAVGVVVEVVSGADGAVDAVDLYAVRRRLWRGLLRKRAEAKKGEQQKCASGSFHWNSSKVQYAKWKRDPNRPGSHSG